MNKFKALITVAAHVAIGVYVIFAIFSPLQKGNDTYNTKSAGVVIEQVELAVEQPEEELQVETVTEVVPEVEADAVEPIQEAVAIETEQVVQTELAPVVAEVEQVAPAAADAQVHVVTAEGLKYNPLVVTIAVGDTVAWENMSSHDTQAIEGLIPEGAEYWHSSMGENFQRTFTQEGIYIYKCTPHFGAGMGGVIIVGNPVNLDAIKAAPVKGATKRLVKKAIKAAEAL